MFGTTGTLYKVSFSLMLACLLTWPEAVCHDWNCFGGSIRGNSFGDKGVGGARLPVDWFDTCRATFGEFIASEKVQFSGER